MKFKCIYFYLLLGVLCFLTPSCIDDSVMPEPPELNPDESYVDPNLPEEIKNGYSITFNISLDNFGGENGTRASNADLMEIDNFIDLEKVRILFFICPYGIDYSQYDETNTYHTGKYDYFLFESKSRWVSQLSDNESTTANWQVTAPVFTYGNNDEYRWEDIRAALTNYPFKVVVLANRPDVVNFGNFDSKFNGDVIFNTGRGPNWGPNDTYIPEKIRKDDEKDQEWNKKPTINDLHHCQWDVVYASKNSGDKKTELNPYGGAGVYSFIMKNPTPEKNNPVPQPDLNNPKDEVQNTNLMGALSVWTSKDNVGNGEENCYFQPDKTQGIPMYGVQYFDAIPDWKEGMPYNLSDRHLTQSGQYERKNIYLLRSLVKLELKIPKRMKKGNTGKEEEIFIDQPYLCYSNVTARCEPLDVATPTELIWKTDQFCEWKDILAWGPIIDQDYSAPTLDIFHQRMAWFYGAWRDWWDFNYLNNKVASEQQLDPKSPYFDFGDHPSPRIYNPVIQRNEKARIDKCKVDDEDYHYYVVYTGERNINDPTKFGQTDSFRPAQSHVAFFRFTVTSSSGNKTYCIALTDYKKNKLITNKTYYDSSTGAIELDKYREAMVKNANNTTAENTSDNWNWPLLRNHVYTFTVNSLGDFSDTGDGLDVTVVSSEKRVAPGYWFN